MLTQYPAGLSKVIAGGWNSVRRHVLCRCSTGVCAGELAGVCACLFSGNLPRIYLSQNYFFDTETMLI